MLRHPSDMHAHVPLTRCQGTHVKDSLAMRRISGILTFLRTVYTMHLECNPFILFVFHFNTFNRYLHMSSKTFTDKVLWVIFQVSSTIFSCILFSDTHNTLRYRFNLVSVLSMLSSWRACYLLQCTSTLFPAFINNNAWTSGAALLSCWLEQIGMQPPSYISHCTIQAEVGLIMLPRVWLLCRTKMIASCYSIGDVSACAWFVFQRCVNPHLPSFIFVYHVVSVIHKRRTWTNLWSADTLNNEPFTEDVWQHPLLLLNPCPASHTAQWSLWFPTFCDDILDTLPSDFPNPPLQFILGFCFGTC